MLPDINKETVKDTELLAADTEDMVANNLQHQPPQQFKHHQELQVRRAPVVQPIMARSMRNTMVVKTHTPLMADIRLTSPCTNNIINSKASRQLLVLRLQARQVMILRLHLLRVAPPLLQTGVTTM